ncbi:MAG TPA: energy transducer TonB [Bacteroidales bacterium]|nr:energy transducer TonB [Bacteroidales bacterium]HRR05166.1 energy transducer TonB [Bacteroidales bacterium]HRT13515.1 energy transducer TonB [Bacteroidales bacterium]HXK73894.1 energy transducer TonB [Bacteroidales bacterium]
MLQKKSFKGDLEGKKGTFVLIGLAIVLGLVYAGFELFATQPKDDFVYEMEEEVIIIEDNVIATDQTPPPPPTPQQQQQEVVIKIVDHEVKVNTNISFSVEIDEDEDIDFYDKIEIIDDPIEEAPIVRFAEKMPEFIGGPDALYAFLQKNLEYPQSARDNNIEGTVLIEFVVERNGSVSNAKVIVPLFPACDQEAIRVVQMLPKWKPGEQMGKPVRVYFNLPIKFTFN